MPAFDIGLSGLSVSQRLLDLTGQNISNANNPAYHRQVADLGNRVTGANGNGVEILQVRRVQSSLLDGAVQQNQIEAGDVTAQLDTLRQVQSLLTPGTGSVPDLIEKFFNNAQQLASSPDDLAQRGVVLGAAKGLTNEINATANGLAQLSTGLDAQVNQAVDQVNSLAPEIARLNEAIQRYSLQGGDTNDLRDQRDQLVGQLAQLIDVHTVNLPDGQTNVIGAGAPLVLGNQTLKLQFSTDQTNQAVLVRVDKLNDPLSVTGGKIAGLLQARNQALPDFRGRLDALAQQLAHGLDEIQATGLGLSGPVTSLAGTRAVRSTTAPLAQAPLAFPPQAGTLTVSVTELATGKRTQSQLTINPATQSLQDVANALGGVPNLQGVVDPQTNTLQILAKPGYAFDFAGRLPTVPDTTAVTGTAVPQIGGSYAGSANDNYTFTVVGSGTVGVTPNLSLQVQNAAGTVLGSLNIGQGYEAGSALPAVNGVKAQLSGGTVNAGDSFSTRVVAQPDSAGLLPALGLNTFFSGSDASNLTVRSDLLNNPNQLAASRTGQPGDASNLSRLTALHDQPLLANGTQTLPQFANAAVGDIGLRVQSLDQQQTAQNALGQQLQAQQQSVSGVDPNEELVHMLQYQQAFQMSAQYISVVNSTLDSLLQIIK